jgi:hypothetical protein
MGRPYRWTEDADGDGDLVIGSHFLLHLCYPRMERHRYSRAPDMGMAVLDRMSRAGDGGRAEPGWFESLNPSSSSTTLAWAATGYLTWLCGVLSPLIWCLDCSAIHYIAASKHDR